MLLLGFRSRSLRRPVRGFALLLLCVALISTTGCFGRFPITRAAYRFNHDISDNEFLQTLTFWGMLLTFYPYGLIGDLLFLNPVEFWSGEKLELEDRRYTSDATPILPIEKTPRTDREREAAFAWIPPQGGAPLAP
jgi:hypothetical protein